MWLGCVFANPERRGICILSLTRMVRLRLRQYITVQYGMRILSVRTANAVDKVGEAVILSSTRSAKSLSVSGNSWDRSSRWLCTMTSVFIYTKYKLHSDFWKKIRLPACPSVGGPWASVMQALVFFTDLLCGTRPNCTSPGKSINKTADTGVTNNHAEFSKCLHTLRKPRFGVECRLWELLGPLLSRRYSGRNLSTILSNAGEVRSGCWWRRWWLLFFSMTVPQHTQHVIRWVVRESCFPEVLFYVLVTSPGQPAVLTSLCLATFFGDSWQQNFAQTHVTHLRS